MEPVSLTIGLFLGIGISALISEIFRRRHLRQVSS